MKALNKKLGKNSGFTLVEMLIVVAIIAILIAVSIPLIGSALEKARDATDQANERAAKAEAAIVMLNQDEDDYKDLYAALIDAKVGLIYNADKGSVEVAGKSGGVFGNGYGRCTGKGSSDYCTATKGGGNGVHTDYHINISYSEATGYTITWQNGTAAHG